MQKPTLPKWIFYFFFSLQGIPTCPVNLDTLRSRLPDLSCWGPPHFLRKEDFEGAAGNNNNNNNNSNSTTSSNCSTLKSNSSNNTTPLHRFYKQQRKMPGFRGRRGLCGCFQVKFLFFLFISIIFFHFKSQIFTKYKSLQSLYDNM